MTPIMEELAELKLLSSTKKIKDDTDVIAPRTLILEESVQNDISLPTYPRRSLITTFEQAA